MKVSDSEIRARFDRKWRKDPETGCWMWTASVDGNGYGKLANGRGGWGLAHRVSWGLHREPIPDGLCVLHRCDTPACVNPEHLFLGTMGDNNRDRAGKGRGVHGSRHPSAKLSPKLAREIRELFSVGWRECELARAYGVRPPSIRKVVEGRSWKQYGFESL